MEKFTYGGVVLRRWQCPLNLRKPVASHLGVVAHDTVVSHDAIVRNMAVGHDETVISYHGLPSVLGSPVDGNKFPDGGIVADFNGGLLSFKFQVLGGSSNNRSWKDPAVFPDPGSIHDGYIAANPGSFSNFHILVDDRKRIDLDIGRDLCILMDIGMGVDH
jgi:hypothetical protein